MVQPLTAIGKSVTDFVRHVVECGVMCSRVRWVDFNVLWIHVEPMLHVLKHR